MTILDMSRQKHLHVQNKRGMGRGMASAPEVLLINGPAIGGEPAKWSKGKRKQLKAGLFD